MFRMRIRLLIVLICVILFFCPLEDNEEYFVLGEEVDIERIKSAQQLVESTERIVPNVYRDPLVGCLLY